jgi:hypothetical protein
MVGFDKASGVLIRVNTYGPGPPPLSVPFFPKTKKIPTSLQGVVTYDDVFGDPHETKFKRYALIWRLNKTKSDDIFETPDSPSWRKTDDAEDNRAT